MLQKIADIIRANVRQADLIARYSGDIFAVLPEAADIHTAFASMERIRASIEQSDDIPLTVSIGLASFPQDASSKEELVRKAEEALQWAKIRGENKIYFFEKEEPIAKTRIKRVITV